VSKIGFFNRLSTRLAAAFLLASIVGVALVAFLAYRSSTTGLSVFINSMRGSGCFGGGMMVEQLIAQAQQAYYAQVTGYLWIAGAGGVALSLFLGWLFSRQTVKPLGEIAQAARRVASGDLEHKVDIRSYGEVSELADSFNNMAETLRHDRDLRRNMTADIAHELRTPLSILQGNIEAMQDGIVPVNDDSLGSLHSGTLELARLVDDLRTLSLAEAQQLKFDFEMTDAAGLALRVSNEFTARASKHGIVISVDAPDGLPEIKIDPARTAQVLRNLLENALRYSPEGSNVEMKVSFANGKTEIAVTDHGPGIAEEHLPFIFERFYRIDRSRTRSTGGSGLGLAIAKYIVEAQGGRIKAESTPGGGSTFKISLPAG
jgi:two-component system sensor histidine kinase BaeS